MNGWTDVHYPTVMPSPVRLSDGSVLTQTGQLLPFAASCPPDTTPDPASMSCVPSPGARNINYECGGVLVPSGAGGCAPNAPRQMARFAIDALEVTGIKPRWPGCQCSEITPDEGGAAVDSGSTSRSRGPSNFDSAFACFLVAVAAVAAFTRK